MMGIQDRITMSHSLIDGLAVSRWVVIVMTALRSTRLTYATAGDGLCSVQAFLIAPATEAHASAAQTRRAAESVFDKCIAGNPSRGGVASNIGM